jgi:transcription elongation factor Elf1
MKTITTLAIAALFAGTLAGAEVITKGGAAQLAKAPYTRTATPAPAAMSCPNCKSDLVTMNVPTFKGSAPTTATVERHACPNCETKLVTSGHGKAKVETATHSCGGCKS